MILYLFLSFMGTFQVSAVTMPGYCPKLPAVQVPINLLTGHWFVAQKSLDPRKGEYQPSCRFTNVTWTKSDEGWQLQMDTTSCVTLFAWRSCEKTHMKAFRESKNSKMPKGSFISEEFRTASSGPNVFLIHIDEKFAVIYECWNRGQKLPYREDKATILSRERHPSTTDLERAELKLLAKGIIHFQFMTIQQNDCPKIEEQKTDLR